MELSHIPKQGNSMKINLGDTLTKISKKDKPWVAHRKNADKVQEIYADAESGAFFRYATRISDCGQWLIFKQFTADELMEHDKKIKLSKAHFCRVRHCPVCAWRRTLALIGRFKRHLPDYLAKYPNYDYIVLTLTVKNPPMEYLRTTIQTMNDAFKKLLKRDAVLKICKGFVKTIEVTKGKDGNPHPHFHVTIAVNKSYFTDSVYIKQKRWVELWRDCLKIDSDPVVHVKKAYVKKSLRENRDQVTAGERVTSALTETVKYSTKEADLIDDPSFLIGLTEQVQRLRFISTGGCLKGILSRDKKQDDPDEITDEEMLLEDDDSDPAKGDQFKCEWNRKNYIVTQIVESKKD